MLNLSKQTIEQLRKSGNKVKIHHYRHVKQDDGEITKFVPLIDIQNRSKVLSCGGVTKLEITTPDKKEYRGQAGCVITDQFSYKKGVLIALGKLEEVKNS